MIQEWNKIKWLSTNCSWWCLLTAHQTKKMQAKYLTCKKQSSTKLIFTQTLHGDTTSWKYHYHSKLCYVNIIRALTTDVHVHCMSYAEFMMLYTYNGRAFTSWTHCKNTPSALHHPPCELLDTSWHTTVKLLSVEISSGFITYKQETVSKHSPVPRPSYCPVVDLYSQEGERRVHVWRQQVGWQWQ